MTDNQKIIFWFATIAAMLWLVFRIIGVISRPYCDIVIENNITYEAFSVRAQGEECENLKQNCRNFTNCKMVEYFGNGFDEEKTEACWCRVENDG